MGRLGGKRGKSLPCWGPCLLLGLPSLGAPSELLPLGGSSASAKALPSLTGAQDAQAGLLSQPTTSAL